VSSFLTAHQHILGYLVPECGNVVQFYNADQRGALSVSPTFWGTKTRKFCPTIGRCCDSELL